MQNHKLVQDQEDGTNSTDQNPYRKTNGCSSGQGISFYGTHCVHSQKLDLILNYMNPVHYTIS
jgi:hypothetical protein